MMKSSASKVRFVDSIYYDLPFLYFVSYRLLFSARKEKTEIAAVDHRV